MRGIMLMTKTRDDFDFSKKEVTLFNEKARAQIKNPVSRTLTNYTIYNHLATVFPKPENLFHKTFMIKSLCISFRALENLGSDFQNLGHFDTGDYFSIVLFVKNK